MNILLVNPGNTNVIQSCFPPELDRGSGWFPHLGILYIAAFLKKESNHAVRVLDMEAERMPLARLAQFIRDTRPDIVGISVSTFNLIDAFLIARAIKEAGPAIHLCLGGPHVNIYPEESVAHPFVDSVILGEGEVPFSLLADAIEGRGSLRQIKGLLYKEAGAIIRTGPPEPLDDLDSLPFPDHSFIPRSERYYNILSHDACSTNMITSRGCPYRCSFCYNLFPRLRCRSNENIIREIRECLASGIRDIFFCDDTFILDRGRTQRLCEDIIANGISFRWSMKTRVDTVDAVTLTALKKAGCRRIHFGVEAGSAQALLSLRKNISLSQIKESFSLTRNAGIETLAYFMIGSPGERVADILETIDLAIALNPDYAAFSMTLPMPGTDLYRRGLEKGVFRDDFWQAFAQEPRAGFSPLFWEEDISEKELQRLLKQAYRSFYLRPRYLLRMLIGVRSLKDFKRRLGLGADLVRYAFQ